MHFSRSPGRWEIRAPFIAFMYYLLYNIGVVLSRRRCHWSREDRRVRRQVRGLRDTGLGPDHRPVRGGGPLLRRGEELQPGGGQAHTLARRIGRTSQGRAALRLHGQQSGLRPERYSSNNNCFSYGVAFGENIRHQLNVNIHGIPNYKNV